ncbi:MAG: anion permease [Bradyrhizobium sp.]|uniref:SLC13 family permease n=1 Tax=Bradyrhizobium sp. TaxID=376 RepID=UPI001D648071|nr:SLC13 family permease [Bradyrhizobium sp.]MBV9563570.1 anion permease [Bradyrhizobium sp.]
MTSIAVTAWSVHPGWFAAAAILLWATNLLPEYLVALLFFAAITLFRAAPADVLFSGFQSEAFWLVLGGFVLGTAIRKVGLADRIARGLANALTGSWPQMVAGVVLLTYALAFVMPSNMGRIALLMPIVMALADRAGLHEGSTGRAALAIGVGLGTYELSASILPANVPNLIMTGAAERAYGVTFNYMPYLLLHAPIIGVLKGILIVACLVRMFPASPKPLPPGTEPLRWRAAELRLAVILLLTLLLWMTDAWHGIRPAWIGLVSACLCLLPRVGFLTSDEFAAGANIRTCLFLAGILGLAAVVAWSGLGSRIGDLLISLLPLDPARPAASFASMIGLASVLNFVVTANGLPAVYTPLAQSLADHAGLALPTVLMSQVFVYSTPWLPYQAAPLVVAIGLAKIPTPTAIKACVVTSAISYAVLGPLYYLWFRLLGWVG